jgi:hypothetical protein
MTNTHDVDTKNPAQEPVVPAPYVDKLTAALAAAGHPNPQGWKQYLEPDAFVTNNDDLQRFLINRALRMVLPMAPVSTMDERYCLVDKGDVGRWFELVESMVVPCMVQHNLPITK